MGSFLLAAMERHIEHRTVFPLFFAAFPQLLASCFLRFQISAVVVSAGFLWWNAASLRGLYDAFQETVSSCQAWCHYLLEVG